MVGKHGSGGFGGGDGSRLVSGGSGGGNVASLRVTESSAAMKDPLLLVKVPVSGGFGGGSLRDGMLGFVTPASSMMPISCSRDVMASVLNDGNGAAVFGGVLETTNNVSTMANGSLESSLRDSSSV